MKRVLHDSLVIIWVACILVSCGKEEVEKSISIAPILKEISFPNENNAIPGKDATILGKGFSKEDKVFLEASSELVEVEVLAVTNNDIKISLPREVGGKYKVIIERDGKRTTLDDELSVPFVIPLDNIVMPVNSFSQEAEVEIVGQGFEAGDKVLLSASFYPQGKEIKVSTMLTDEGISFRLPVGCFGVNTVIVTRENRKTNVGTIGIEVNVGQEIGGGVVFWTDASKVHGLISNKSTIGSATEAFGPRVALSGAAGTSKALGTGKDNTAKLISKMNAFRQNSASWNGRKSAAEVCAELAVTIGSDTYKNWFLPSLEELIEVFKKKELLASKGVTIPPNNYWSSSEGDGDAAGWSAYYVNFYEPANVVSGAVDKEGWQIGIIPIRSF